MTLMPPGVSAAVRTFLSKPHPLFIGGEWVEPVGGGSFLTFDPATGAPLAEIGEADAVDVDRAVKAARAAFNGPWSRLTARARANLLFRLAELITAHQDTFEQLEVLDRRAGGRRPRLFRHPSGVRQHPAEYAHHARRNLRDIYTCLTQFGGCEINGA